MGILPLHHPASANSGTPFARGLQKNREVNHVSSLGPSLPQVTLGQIGDTAVQRAGLSRRREQLFRESSLDKCERVVLGTVWSLHPKRIEKLLSLARIWIKDIFEPELDLPDVAGRPESGEIVGIVNDLSVPTLLEAYARGLFPFSHVGPPKWLCPPERCVLFFDEFHMSKRLKRLMRQGRYTVTFDRDFEGVIKACAGKREGRFNLTWITPRIMRAYARLFDAGYVHSFEVWNADGKLVGGGYGVALGKIFFTELQFSHEPSTSKLGFSVLNWHLARWGYVLNDGKWETPTILDMGFRSIPRREFLRILATNTGEGGKGGHWSVEAGLDAVAAWQEAPKAERVASAMRRSPPDGRGGSVDLIERPQGAALKRGVEPEDTETAYAALQRWVLGLAWSLKPPRLYGVPATLLMVARYYAGFGLKPGELPDPDLTLRHPDGLAGICAEMSVQTLRAAYAKGLFPFAHVGPKKWWAPRQRMALFFDDFRIEKNLRRRMRRNDFVVSFDQAFDAVVRACAEPRPGRLHLTWITPDVMNAMLPPSRRAWPIRSRSGIAPANSRVALTVCR